ncbi:MAG: Gfo/Idh/MocA family oxidoreductase [Candidatus Nitrohelix vancouverensis]|uniref:Gfo/Idh/MocA family oxidoreductase n=1 Tax=Candidatus Nitrohelix vancouverensis TaxID=2705534 RepID=A0A7T0C250_9BACT|nr:MAG: Gfo/Idh/MocA family oxidoreductase [Candidatus Nitrohelix vancouverensis]
MGLLKIGLMGCGRIGSLLEEDPLRGKPCTHAGAFASLRQVKIQAGTDIDADRLRRFGQRWGVDNLYRSYEEMLAQERLDIVCIASWTRLHAPMVMAAARAGVAGIFCEKPIALDPKEGARMVALCARKKIPLVINHERRWDPHYLQARKLIQKGKIGEVKTITGNALSWRPPKAPIKDHGGGPLFHDGTHLIDLLLYLGGPVDWASGVERRSHGKRFIEETAAGMLGFKSGAIGFVEGGGERKYFNFELDIQGTEGRLLIGNAGRQLFVTKRSRRFTGFHELEAVPFPEPARYQSPFVGAAKDMIQCVRNGKPSLSSGKDALQALKIIFTIYRSAQLKGRRLNIE